MARERRDRGDTDSRDNALVDFVVKIRRSACVVKGGRRFSFNALVVVGDKRGKVAFGYGKANEVPPSVEKAIKEGEGNIQRTRKIALRGSTIPHRVIGKFGDARVTYAIFMRRPVVFAPRLAIMPARRLTLSGAGAKPNFCARVAFGATFAAAGLAGMAAL